MAKQALIHHVASCCDCIASVDAANAIAWAHNHANKHGHRVNLSMGWSVYNAAPAAPKGAKNG